MYFIYYIILYYLQSQYSNFVANIYFYKVTKIMCILIKCVLNFDMIKLNCFKLLKKQKLLWNLCFVLCMNNENSVELQFSKFPKISGRVLNRIRCLFSMMIKSLFMNWKEASIDFSSSLLVQWSRLACTGHVKVWGEHGHVVEWLYTAGFPVCYELLTMCSKFGCGLICCLMIWFKGLPLFIQVKKRYSVCRSSW